MKTNLPGWNEYFESAIQEYTDRNELTPARVTRVNREQFDLLCDMGNFKAVVTGAFSYNAERASDFPAVGDWVMVNTIPEERKAFIHAVLPRKTCLTRKSAGITTDEQVLVSNVDTVFIVVGLNNDFNLRRIERYLTIIKNRDINPVILLNKSDISPDPLSALVKVQDVALDSPVHYLSAAVDKDIDFIHRFIPAGETVAFIGSSGAGKSTIINRLLNSDTLRTQEISSAVNKGTHTTTWRELIVLPSGGIVIDTPGLRELQLWVDEDDLSASFADIDSLAEGCRFSDCRHLNEPGCAVLEAVEVGELDEERLSNYRKMEKEIKFLARRKDQKARLEEKNKWKKIAKFGKELKKGKYKGNL